jgi:DNA polymerase-3 subunit delta'
VPFRDIVGHRRLIALLSRAIAQGTLPPSLIFSGPSGVGKRLTALAAAQALNCLEPRASAELPRDACGACPACRRIARLVHPDVILLSPGETGSIRIESVREVIDKASYRPFEGRRRVVIVDEADALVPQAQNALLKTLEEPPSGSIFCLVSAMPDALLPTVQSRCPRLRFGPLSSDDVAALLVRDHEYADVDARAVAADAGGSVGQALESASADLVAARDVAARLLEDVARSRDPVRCLEAARDLGGKKATPAAEREQLSACLRAVASLLRDAGVVASGADERVLANADLLDLVRRLAPAYAGERGVRAYAAVDRALTALAAPRNASPKIVADWLVLQL